MTPTQERDILHTAFADVCDELGCAYDNEAALFAVHQLRAERDHFSRAFFITRILIDWDAFCQRYGGSYGGREKLMEAINDLTKEPTT